MTHGIFPFREGGPGCPGYHRAGGTPCVVFKHAPHEINIPCSGPHRSSSSHTGSRPAAPLGVFPPRRPVPSAQ